MRKLLGLAIGLLGLAMLTFPVATLVWEQQQYTVGLSSKGIAVLGAALVLAVLCIITAYRLAIQVISIEPPHAPPIRQFRSGETAPLPFKVDTEKFRFMVDGDKELASFTQLAEDTHALGWFDVREPSPESAAFLLHHIRRGSRLELPPDLDGRWREWADRYFEIRKRSPQLEMRDLIQDITERQEGLSWPFYATEDVLEEWIVAGNFDAPIETGLYSAEYVTRPVFDRLRELRFLTGGWIYDDGAELRFASGEEWERVKAELRSARERTNPHLRTAKWADTWGPDS